MWNALLLLLLLLLPLSLAATSTTPTIASLQHAAMDADSSGAVSVAEFLSHVGAAPSATAALLAAFRALDGDASGDVTLGELAAATHDVGLLGLNPEPQEVHLALTGKPAEMRVMWVSGARYDAAPTVVFGVDPALPPPPSSATAAGVSATYTVPKRWWPGFNGWIHDVLMTGLVPGRRFFYRVQGTIGGKASTSGVFNFTAPALPAPDAATRLLVYGDMGVIPLGFLVAREIRATPTVFNATLHVGDISYAGIDTSIPFLNISKADEMEAVWDQWATMVQPFAADKPYMATIGNHELFYNRTAFTHRFHGPDNGKRNTWFSFDVGNVHVTSMSTEDPYTPGSPQLTWLAADLAAAAANRATVPWLVLVGHRPLYCSDTSEWSAHRPGAPLLSSVEPLLLHHGVDLTITGHQHCYERTFPVANGTVTTTGKGSPPVYTNAGAPLHVVVGTAGALQEETFVDPVPAWSAKRAANTLASYGFGDLTVFNATHLRWRFQAVDSAGDDEVWVVKQQ